MASVNGIVTGNFCGRLIGAVQDNTLWDLRAWGTVDGGSLEELDHQTPNFADSSKTYSGISSSLDLYENVEFILEEKEIVTEVRLYNVAGSGGIMEISAPLTTENEFPAGGKLIVSSFKFTVED